MTTMRPMGSARSGGIQPFIDLNENRGRPVSIPDSITIESDGTPLCMVGLRMVNWGDCKQKHSRKWRCPLLPAGKPTPAPARRNVPLLPMDAVSTQNLTGTSGSSTCTQRHSGISGDLQQPDFLRKGQ